MKRSHIKKLTGDFKKGKYIAVIFFVLEEENGICTIRKETFATTSLWRHSLRSQQIHVQI